MCLVLIDRPVKRSVKPPFRRNLLGRLHGETIRKLMKMRHHDHDVLQQELRPTDPDILGELERKHIEVDACKHDLDSGLQAVISDISEYETDDPDSDNDYGALGWSNHYCRYINYDVTTSSGSFPNHSNYDQSTLDNEQSSNCEESVDDGSQPSQSETTTVHQLSQKHRVVHEPIMSAKCHYHNRMPHVSSKAEPRSRQKSQLQSQSLKGKGRMK